MFFKVRKVMLLSSQMLPLAGNNDPRLFIVVSHTLNNFIFHCEKSAVLPVPNKLILNRHCTTALKLQGKKAINHKQALCCYKMEYRSKSVSHFHPYSLS